MRTTIKAITLAILLSACGDKPSVSTDRVECVDVPGDATIFDCGFVQVEVVEEEGELVMYAKKVQQ